MHPETANKEKPQSSAYLIKYYSAASALAAEHKMPRQWCDCSNTANRAVKANELSPLSDEAASAFFHAFSTVPPCETEDSDRKMTAEENRESEETAEAVRSILSSTSILCDFTKNTNYQNVNVAIPHRQGRSDSSKLTSTTTTTATTATMMSYGRPVRVIIQVPIVLYVLPKMADSSWITPRLVNVGWKLTKVIIRFVTHVQRNRTNKKIVQILDAIRRGI